MKLPKNRDDITSFVVGSLVLVAYLAIVVGIPVIAMLLIVQVLF